MKLDYLRKLGLPTLACVFIAFNACDSDDNPKPDDDTEVTGGSAGEGGSGGSGGSGGTGGGSGGSGGNTNTTSNSGGAGGTAGTGTETATTGGGGEAGETSTDSGGTGGTGGTGGGTGLPECDEPSDDDCYDLAECAPTEATHLLNQCTESECFSFDNADRLPLYNGGDLPPVP